MGTYIFSPTFLMDAHFGFAKQVTNSEQPGLGTNVGSDVLGIPGTNGTRLFESGWPTFEFEGRLRHGRRERELHAVLPARSAGAIRRELQLDEEQAQHPVRRRLLSHGVEPCAGGVHHRRLRRAGRLRVRPRHHGAVRGRRSGVGQLPADLRRLPVQQRGSVRARPGQQRRQNAAGAGRVQRAGKPLQLLHPRSVDHRRQPHARLRHAVGVLPASDPTRPRHRAVRRHHQQGAALRHRRHTHRLRHQGEQDAVRPARGHGLSHRRQRGSCARATA